MTQNNKIDRPSTLGYVVLVLIFLMGVLIGALPSIVAAVKPLVCGG